MLSLGRLQQRIELKCMSHVQHNYFSAFNQSDHCFLVLSLRHTASMAEEVNLEQIQVVIKGLNELQITGF